MVTCGVNLNGSPLWNCKEAPLSFKLQTRASSHPEVALDRAPSRRARRGRGRRPRGEADLLLRGLRGRRLEDHGRRRILAQHIRRLLPHLRHRSARGRRRRPIGRIRRHGRGVHPKQRLTRRRRLPLHRRRAPLGRTSGSTTRGIYPGCAWTRATPTGSTSPRSGTPSAPTLSGESSAPPTAAARGSASCSRARGQAQ